MDYLGMPRLLTNANGQTVWSATVLPYGEVVETPAIDPLSGRTIATNLRLPGQYDERLFGPLGLQGPYYNWNRWYLPGVGRYLEPDPVALEGGFNGAFGPDWYAYANQNPLSFVDPLGLKGLSFSEWLGSLGLATEMTFTWALGFGNHSPTFGTGTVDGWAIAALRSEYVYQVMLEDFRRSKAKARKRGICYGAHPIDNPFGAFIGSATITMTSGPNGIHVRVWNRTSLTSFGHPTFNPPYELPSIPSWSQWVGGPLSNVDQTYEWNEEP